VCRPIPENATISLPNDQTMQPYAVAFRDEFASTEPIGDGPEDQRTAEFMIVRVMEGSFAIDLETDEQGNAQQVLVSTAQDHIETLTPYVPATPYYGTPAPNGVPFTVNGEVCTRACPVDPDVPILLVPGDTAVAERGALCIYCLLHGNTGLLEVSVALDPGQDFTWIADWDSSQSTASTEPAVMAWAFLNPGRCDHG
ncbi:MAG: hypothetical protein K0S78_6445, partial [Thermomicrobiales bacterium]|nr:hypothetical protein [Thermomicrobiales bacterium]